MDFETWYSALCPPSEALLMAARVGDNSYEGLEQFAKESPENAAWLNRLYNTHSATQVVRELLECHEAKDDAEIAHDKYVKAVKFAEAANYALEFLASSIGQVSFDYSDCPVIIDRFEKSAHLVPLIMAVDAATTSVGEYAHKRDRAMEEWTAAVKRQWKSEAQLRTYFKNLSE